MFFLIPQIKKRSKEISDQFFCFVLKLLFTISYRKWNQNRVTSTFLFHFRSQNLRRRKGHVIATRITSENPDEVRVVTWVICGDSLVANRICMQIRHEEMNTGIALRLNVSGQSLQVGIIH